MKKLLKLTLLVAAVLSFSSVSAQKFARINSQEIMMAMPDLAEIEKKLEALSKDWQERLEQIKVDYNKKAEDYQKNQATMSATVKQMYEKDLASLQQNFAENQQMAQQDLQKNEQEWLEPVQKKVQDAIKKVAKAGNYIAVFDTMVPSLVYYDEAQMVDIAPLVKKELGIAATPAAPAKK